jgi:hypothetical protein
MKRVIGGRISLTNNYAKHETPINTTVKKVEVVETEPVKQNVNIDNVKNIDNKTIDKNSDKITKVTRNEKILKFINFKV